MHTQKKDLEELPQNSVIFGMCLWVIFAFFKPVCNFLLFIFTMSID